MLSRADDPWLRDGLLELQRREDVFVWPDSDFEPLRAGVEDVFAELRLLRPARSVAA